MYLINVLDDSGNFEMIDSELLELYPDLNPESLITINDKQYQDFCANDNGNTKFISGKFVFEKTQENTTALLAKRKEELLKTIADKTDSIKSQYLSGYPQTEIESFYRQEKEALAWQADNHAETPMLKQIAALRGIGFEILVQKVIEKSNMFAVAIGSLIGIRQGFEDRILAAKTQKTLTEIEKEVNQWKL